MPDPHGGASRISAAWALEVETKLMASACSTATIMQPVAEPLGDPHALLRGDVAAHRPARAEQAPGVVAEAAV